MCSASQTAFSTFSDQLLESANLRKIQLMVLVTNHWLKQALIEAAHGAACSNNTYLGPTTND
jgi:hypothetical protein